MTELCPHCKREMPETKELFGAQLKRLRESKGLQQKQLADYLGVDETHICRLESGRNTPSLATCKRISNALGITLSELVENI